jgi:hypothetical protein
MDEGKLHEFMGKFVTDMGGAFMMGRSAQQAKRAANVVQVYRSQHGNRQGAHDGRIQA